MADKYDEAIVYLTKNPRRIRAAWQNPGSTTPKRVAQAHCLFAHVSETGRETTEQCGCLTQVRSGQRFAVVAGEVDEHLSALIEADERIPVSAPRDFPVIRPEHLPVFAEWQRRLDKELGRT